jgi:hypothetical protein
LKAWVSIPWVLDFHMAQINSPVRLLMSNHPDTIASDVVEAEKQVAAIVGEFNAFVCSRKFSPCRDFKNMSAVELLRSAVDKPQLSRQWARHIRAVSGKIKSYGRRMLTG